MATECSNGEPSELKMISAWVLGWSFNFFVRGEDVYVYISIYWCCAWLLALVEILRITLIIIEKCKRH